MEGETPCDSPMTCGDYTVTSKLNSIFCVLTKLCHRVSEVGEMDLSFLFLLRGCYSGNRYWSSKTDNRRWDFLLSTVIRTVCRKHLFRLDSPSFCFLSIFYDIFVSYFILEILQIVSTNLCYHRVLRSSITFVRSTVFVNQVLVRILPKIFLHVRLPIQGLETPILLLTHIPVGEHYSSGD